MITVRDLSQADIPGCVAILNHIIALGGSTAYETPFTEAHFAKEYLRTPPVRNVALVSSRIVGFQAAFDAGGGLYSIGSFTDRAKPVPGAGRALFEKTLADCRARGGEAILARITSDNTGGLAFYSRLGFVDWMRVEGDLTRADGTVVDRIVKRFAL